MEEQVKEILFNPTVGKLVTIVVGFAIIWFVVKSLQNNLFSKIKDKDSRYRAKKFSGFVGYLLTFILIAVVFSNRLGGLTVALGVAGAGIAFALQEVIVSVAGWLGIMFGGFYKTGDRVQLGGVRGDVMDIGVLRTTIMQIGDWVDGDLYNGRIVHISNSFVFKDHVYNYSGEFPFLWDEIKIPVQYGSDYKLTHLLLTEIAKELTSKLSTDSLSKWESLQEKYLLENAQTSPMVSMIANDNWIEFTLRYVVDFDKRRSTKTELFNRILEKVDNTEGKVKMASATFEVVGLPDLQVRLKDN